MLKHVRGFFRVFEAFILPRAYPTFAAVGFAILELFNNIILCIPSNTISPFNNVPHYPHTTLSWYPYHPQLVEHETPDQDIVSNPDPPRFTEFKKVIFT